MDTRTRLVTADELLRMPDDGYWHELVEGRVTTMSPPGFGHGICGARLQRALTEHVERDDLGVVAPQDTGYKLKSNPDTVRAPDVSFVAKLRLPAEGLPMSYWDGAPDLAVEVLSSDDRPKEIAAKAREYLACGTRAVWVVDPRHRTVTVHRVNNEPIRLGEADALTDPDLLPGFSCRIADLFVGLATD